MSAVFAIVVCIVVAGGLAAVGRYAARTYGLNLRLCDAQALAAFAAAPLVRWATPHAPATWSASVALALASVCTVTDIQTGFVFDRVLFTAAPLAFAGAWLDGRIESAVGAFALTAAAFSALFVLSRGGIGLGDVKLASLLAVSLGASGTLRATCAAFCMGAAYGVILLIRGAHRKREVRFAGFLAAGTAYALIESTL
jgi:leader peptidase (prepilin peptidase)/N-methyltransferase